MLENGNNEHLNIPYNVSIYDMIKEVKKRTGEIVRFDSSKIQKAIEKAMLAIDIDTKKSEQYTKETIKLLESKKLKIPSIEEIQDSVEQILEKNDSRLFKIYSLYRRGRHHAREIKKYFKIKDDLKLSVNALKVLEERYLLKDSKGNIIETPTEMFLRVARAIANSKKEQERFFLAMKNLEFLPNSPTLMNAGTKLGQLSACFVLPIEDSLGSIFKTLDDMASIQQSGGGTGFSFSKIRPKGDIVKSTKGVASGPVSFMRIYDETTNTIKQGGKRRGANMGILSVNHPDIIEFINSKQNKKLSNFNISVSATDDFLKKAEKNKFYNLINPRNHEVTGKLNAKQVFDLIIQNAHSSGDPGMIFIDEINRKHPLKGLGKIESTNPCGEANLLPYESCNLGSINLTKIVENQKINWNKLRELTRLGINFLDNVIDKNKFPLPEIEKITKANRKIGLGIMGFADMLMMLKISYNSKEAVRIGENIIKFIYKEARKASSELAKKKGNFPNIKHSKFKIMRNAIVLTIAPTGTISIIAGCSSGIEPLFALAFFRQALENKKLAEINLIFQTELIKRNLWNEKTINQIIKTGTLKNTNLPKDMKKIFITALEIPPEIHVKMQAAFQKHVDNAVSKTVNLPENATKQEVKKVYLLAWKLKCKGITVYRYGSKEKQVLYKGAFGLIAKPQFAQSCPSGVCQL
jgi:ribonucleoside-diphosphate reductase alpha chain